jgi:hypothetical protein
MTVIDRSLDHTLTACIDVAGRLYHLECFPTIARGSMRSRCTLGRVRFSDGVATLEINHTAAELTPAIFNEVIPSLVARAVCKLKGWDEAARWSEIAQTLGGRGASRPFGLFQTLMALAHLPGQRLSRFYVWDGVPRSAYLTPSQHRSMMKQIQAWGGHDLDGYHQNLTFTGRHVLAPCHPLHFRGELAEFSGSVSSA